MNYKLLMTEGSDEKAFLEVLKEKNLLCFSEEELLMDGIYHKRQMDTQIKAYLQQLPCKDSVDIYRVGDKLTDEIRIPQSVSTSKIRAKYKVCTLPEFEILLILYEGLYGEFLKQKSKKKPSEFYKEKHKDYHKQVSYITDYFSEMSDNQIKDLIHLYVKERGNTHKKDQLTLNVLIKN